jgi:integrase
MVKYMDMKTRNVLKQFQQERQITDKTLETYKTCIEHYETINQKTITELIEEADQEEEQGIRWKHRTLRKRLITYQNHLLQEYNYTTAQTYLSKLKTIYRHHLIEIHELPPLNKKKAKLSTPITYNDLPTKDILRKAYNTTTPLIRAYLLFAISTGCARKEILNLKIQDYQEWTKGYDPLTEDIVPTIRLKRQKTNTYYYTFATPEAIREIHHYLESRDDDDPRLFKVYDKHLEERFRILNQQLGLGTINGVARLRTHTLRKFHASQLYNAENGLTLDEIDSLQGRVKKTIQQSYYFDNTEDLKKKYIRNIDQVTILDEVHTITVDSPEVEMLKQKAEKIDELERLVKKIMERNQP